MKKTRHATPVIKYEKQIKLYFGKNNPNWKGGKAIISCLICGKRRKVLWGDTKKGYGKFCSFGCYGQYQKENWVGNKNHHWKGGITSLWQSIRGLEESNIWIQKVFGRDNWLCQKCGIIGNGKNLNAHHKKPFALVLQEFLQKYSQFSPIEDKETLLRLATSYEPFWDIDNGQTLCEDCHKLFPRGVNVYKDMEARNTRD